MRTETTNSRAGVDLPRRVRPGVSGDLRSVAEYYAYTTGSRAYARRIALGMTQEELARRTGLQPAAISHFETGKRRPCLKNLLLLCGALECSPNDLVLGANVKVISHLTEGGLRILD